jgi:hypothetical protein
MDSAKSGVPRTLLHVVNELGESLSGDGEVPGIRCLAVADAYCLVELSDLNAV